MKKRMPSGSNSSTMTKETSDGIKALLGKHVKILLKCPVKMETKGDKTENRILVFCPCRLFCLKVPPRIDFHLHYLELQGIESKKPNQIVLSANDKSYSFVIFDVEKLELVDKMLMTLLSALNDTFPGIPLYKLVKKIRVVPMSRLQHLELVVDSSGGSGINSNCSSSAPSASSTPLPYPKSKSSSSLEDKCAMLNPGGCDKGNLMVTSTNTLLTTSASSILGSNSNNNYQNVLQNQDEGDCFGGYGSFGPCGSFSTQYAWMCDLHGLPYREEVAWDVDTIYLSHDSKRLCLHDFDHLEQRDLVPILSAVEYNTWFKSIDCSNVRLSHDAVDRLLVVVRKSVTIEEIHLENIGAKAEFASKLSQALQQNENSQIHTINLSHNMIEDKGAIHLSHALGKLCRGPVWLNFAQCSLSSKGVAQLAQALAVNKCAPSSLTHLNLSGNSLKDDVNNLYSFLAQPNCITFLDLSATDCNLELVFGAILRGCTSHLAHLNLSRNNFATKKGKEIPSSFKKYLMSSLALKQLFLSSCKLSLEALKQLLLGLSGNDSTADVELDISSNGLGSQGAHVLESCLQNVKCLSSLDISDNNLEGDLAGVILSASKNKSLKNINLGRNLQSTKTKYVAHVMEALVQLLQDEECVVTSLSLADSKLKGEVYSVINALGSNQCLQSIDISGNQMGDVGARLLAKALQINNKLKCIYYDRNNISLQGFSDIAYGLESNMSVRYMPFPVHDALPCMKVSSEKTEGVMKRIQDLIYRNSLPKKTTSGQQAFRLQQGFLWSSAQQTVDKLINQTQESVKVLKKNCQNANASGGAGDGDMYAETISNAEDLISDSERAKQLLVHLHEMIEQKGERGKIFEKKLQNVSDDLHGSLCQLIHSNIDSVLELTREKCPKLMCDEALNHDMRESCMQKSDLSPEFIRHCIMDMAGADIANKVNEIHLAVASHISDKLVDRAIEALMKCHKQLADVGKKRSSTPDVLKTRTRTSPNANAKGAGSTNQYPGHTDEFRELNTSGDAHLDLSPIATPQMHGKRKVNGRKIRPKSVVDCVEGISADDIPDLLPSLPKTIEEITGASDLPPVSPQQLKHLGKGRPRKPKTRAPTRPCLKPAAEVIEEIQNMQEGLDSFFRPGSTTPTPLVTPDSDECSTSLMISITSGGGDPSSIQSTPTHSSCTFKAENNSGKTSPGSLDSCSISSERLAVEQVTVPRSKSTDCIEKPAIDNKNSSPVDDEASIASTISCKETRSPMSNRVGVNVMGSSVLAEMKARQDNKKSLVTNSVTSVANNVKATSLKQEAESVSISVNEAKEKFGSSKLASGFLRKTSLSSTSTTGPPPVAPKPRPWSMIGSDRRSGEYSYGNEGSSPTNSPLNNSVTGNANERDSIVDKEDLGSTRLQNHLDKCSAAESALPPSTGIFKTKLHSNGNQNSGVSSGALNDKHSTSGVDSNMNSAFKNSESSVSTKSSCISNFKINSSTSSSTVEVGCKTLASGISSSTVAPKSLPAWNVADNCNAVENKEKMSVKELAASLNRQQQEQKKKSDSLPRNLAPPSNDHSDVNRARMSMPDWSKHLNESRISTSTSNSNSILHRKREPEIPVNKRWGLNSNTNGNYKSFSEKDSSGVRDGAASKLRKNANQKSEDIIV